MVIKDTDSINSKIEALTALLSEKLSATQRKQVQFEISMLKKGFQGEKQAAYFKKFRLYLTVPYFESVTCQIKS